MKDRHVRRIGALAALVAFLTLMTLNSALSAAAEPRAQDATPSGPFVTGIGEGATIRSGPGTTYDRVGRIVAGQVAQVLGKAVIGADGAEPVTWLQIVYLGPNDNTGWVWIDNIAFTGQLDTVPDAQIPATPTRVATPTLEFGGVVPTDSPVTVRPPTFTAPAVVLRPTLLPVTGATPAGTAGVPPMLIILVLVVVGGFMGMLSFFEGKR
jgi:uncharacterized protein YraI